MDTNAEKFEQAKKWGATDCVNPKDSDKPIQVRQPSTTVVTPCPITLAADAATALTALRRQQGTVIVYA